MKLMLFVVAWMVFYMLTGRQVGRLEIVIWWVLFILGSVWEEDK